MSDTVEVSVICCTYNHEKYIRSALEGFVAQQTDFKFEVLVHDDASTDKTAEIVREYERSYPYLIKGVYQTQNQYSQGKTPSRILASLAKGKYLALCEGDDYWIDPLKLQKQYDELEKHPNFGACGHSAVVVSNKRVVGAISPKTVNCVLPVQFFLVGNVATASLMFRRDLFNQVPSTLDYFLRIYVSIPNGMLYLKDVMSVYRKGVQGSWNTRMRSDKKAAYAFRENVIIPGLSLLNHNTNGVYDAEIKKCLRSCECEQLLTLGNYKRAIKEYGDVLKELPRGIRQNTKLSAISPFLGRMFSVFKQIGYKMLIQPIRRVKYRKYRRLIQIHSLFCL